MACMSACSSAALPSSPGTNQPVALRRPRRVTIAAGEWPGATRWRCLSCRMPWPALLAGRKLAVSLHVAGESGPMTWHAKALQTSYVRRPAPARMARTSRRRRSPSRPRRWFFLDALDVHGAGRHAGDRRLRRSITDGTASTMNGDDRWPDVLSRRLHARYGHRSRSSMRGSAATRWRAGRRMRRTSRFPAGRRRARGSSATCLSLSGVSAVIWLEGTNDFSRNGNASADTVQAAMRDGVGPDAGADPGRAGDRRDGGHGLGQHQRRARLRRAGRQAEGAERLHPRRRALRRGGRFRHADARCRRPAALRPEFVPESTTGGPGDKLHPNRAGYQAMGRAIDIGVLLPGFR